MFLAFPSENERMVCVGCSLAFMIGLESRERLETCGKMLLSSLWPCGLCFSVAFLRPKSHGPSPQAKIIHKDDVYVSVLYFMLGTEKLKKHYYLIALSPVRSCSKVVSSSTLTIIWPPLLFQKNNNKLPPKKLKKEEKSAAYWRLWNTFFYFWEWKKHSIKRELQVCHRRPTELQILVHGPWIFFRHPQPS